MELKPISLNINIEKPLVISGPCSAETQEQVLRTAHQLKDIGIQVFRAGVWKPRTKPGSFEGVGIEALKWLNMVQQETGMLVCTEVATSKHVEEALKHSIDLLWIGARTTVNPFAVQEIADTLKGTNIPVLIKNPVNPDLELWIGAIQRLYNVGITNLGVIHRGFSTSDKTIYRNQPMWHIPIELKRIFPELTIVGDPSHIGGSRELIQMLSQQAMDLNYDGLIIESHCTPDEAWSDAAQQVTPESLKQILDSLIVRNDSYTTDDISSLRHQIDDLDIELFEILAKRMRICRELGQFKKERNIPILQTDRYDEILNDRAKQAANLDMSVSFSKKVLEAIHLESIRQQFKIMESKTPINQP